MTALETQADIQIKTNIFIALPGIFNKLNAYNPIIMPQPSIGYKYLVFAKGITNL
jgi:hypothetical protein